MAVAMVVSVATVAAMATAMLAVAVEGGEDFSHLLQSNEQEKEHPGQPSSWARP
jgi:hypothetical protein